MRFSARTAWDRTENELAGLDEAARTTHGRLLDLTVSNPTRAGLPLPLDLLAELGHPRGATYEPEAAGHRVAREAVAGYYAARGTPVDPARILLSASTSESYGWLFKLLGDPGDEVLVPVPSYPLFPFLAGMEGITLTPFRIHHSTGGAAVDFDDLEARVSPRTRAILLVHPNNPTGCFVAGADRARLVAFAARHRLALVVDEVFADFAFDAPRRVNPPGFAGTAEVPTFVLSGLSKVAALPQLKLGWIAVSGPPAEVAEALGRLEIVADCYLSVATPVQLALPALLGARERLQAPLVARTAANNATLDAALVGRADLTRLGADAGWYAVLAQDVFEDQTLAERLLAEDGVQVHPGFFFDYPEEGRIVISLLSEPAALAEGIGRILDRVGQGF